MGFIKCECKGCTKRFVGCHSTCESYKKHKECVDKLKAEYNKKIWIDNELNRFKRDAIEKIKRVR